MRKCAKINQDDIELLAKVFSEFSAEVVAEFHRMYKTCSYGEFYLGINGNYGDIVDDPDKLRVVLQEIIEYMNKKA